MDRVVENIKKFVDELLFKYMNKITISYRYDKNENEYRIWHNSSKLNNDSEFRRFTYELQRKHFIDNWITNVSFGYDNFKIEK